MDSEGDNPSVSIVVVAREGFASAPQNLVRLFAETDHPFKLIYVLGGAPLPLRGKLKKLVLDHQGTVICCKRFLRPTQARNIGLGQVDTKYTVFLDNDVQVTSGWLRALVACADATNADYVSPVVRQPLRGVPYVHVAGGVNSIVTGGNGASFRESYAHMHQPYANVVGQIVRQEVSMAEFHAVLVRTATLNKLGGLDERCSTAFEHNDLCLSIKRLGGSGWLEPDSIVDYTPDAAGKYGNFTYCLARWSKSWIAESHQAFCAKWGFAPDDPAFEKDLQSLDRRRKRPLRYVRGATRRIGGDVAVSHLDSAVDSLVEWYLRYFHNDDDELNADILPRESRSRL